MAPRIGGWKDRLDRPVEAVAPMPAKPLRLSPLEDGAEVLARLREREGV